jgi:hypothetical protein
VLTLSSQHALKIEGYSPPATPAGALSLRTIAVLAFLGIEHV